MNDEQGSILVTPRSFRKMDGPHWNKLRASPYRTINSPHRDKLMTEEEMIDYVSTKEIRGIIVGLDPISKKVFHKASRLEVVAKYGTGLDNIDLQAAEEFNVKVTFTPGANTQSVADLTMGLMLAVARRIPAHDRALRNKTLTRQKGRELWSKTLGIVGLGSIGTAVARRARGFQMKTLYTDVERKRDLEIATDLRFVSLDKLLQNSDFVSLHCPLTEKTESLMGRPQLKMMNKASYLINTARHGLVNQPALVEALAKGQIAGAALDTFDKEQHLDSELLSLENFVGSPHAGASTTESVLRMASMATEDLLRVLGGEEPMNPVPTG